MPAPKILFNLSIIVAAFATALYALLMLAPPYTGFNLEKLPASQHLSVSRLDDWVAEQGLQLGDQIVSIATLDGLSLDLELQHIPESAFDDQGYYEDLQAEFEQRFSELTKVYEIVREPIILLNFPDKPTLQLNLNHRRPLSSLSWDNWSYFFIGLLAWFPAALVWAWRPHRKETAFLLLSGVGFFFTAIRAGASVANIEMYYVHPIVQWLVSEILDIGRFMFISFPVCLLLYFPQRIENAGLWAKRLLTVTFAFAIFSLFNGWDFSKSTTEQFLFFSHNESLMLLPFYYSILLALFVQQWRMSFERPVERAQTWWMILAWTLGPCVFMVFYLLPLALGQEPMLIRPWTSFTLLISPFGMMLLGASRLKFFNLERHVGTAYQWCFVSLFFFSIDIVLISVINVSPQISTFIIIALVLWGYLPIRQWFQQRFTRNRQHRYQQLFNEAVITMVEGSLVSAKKPEAAWNKTLDSVFAPVKSSSLQESESTPITEARVKNRGQELVVAGNRYSTAIKLEFAENGSRLFSKQDESLIGTLSLLFVRLYEFRDAYFSGQIQERERIRRDLHDQIGSKLLSLIYTAKDDKSRQLAQETMEQLRELIRALKKEPVSLQNAVAEMRQHCHDTCENVGMSLHWHDSLSDGGVKISSNQYLNILNIVRELLNNTIRHARASNVTISFATQGDFLRVSLADNGVGFDRKSVNPGNGLYNIQSRVRELDAEIEWHTPKNTITMLSIPI